MVLGWGRSVGWRVQLSPSDTSRVRYASRLRNEALGGLEDAEDLQMSFIECFLVLRTKHGSHLDGGSNDDGLLVIDFAERYPKLAITKNVCRPSKITTSSAGCQ